MNTSHRELTFNLNGPAVNLFRSLSVLAVSADLVAYAANGSNQRAVVSGIHFAAKIVDVHIHDVGHGVEIKFPHLLDYGSAGNGLALVAHQKFEQSEFLGAEIDVVTSLLRFVR